MKKINLLLYAMVFMLSAIKGQTYSPISVRGFNTKGILAGTDARSASDAIDGETTVSAYLFVTNYSPNGSTYFSANGLPTDGIINSNGNTGVNYSLNYSGNNTLKIQPNTSQTLTFTSSNVYSNIWILGTSGNGASSSKVVVNYSDGTSVENTGYSVPDWLPPGTIDTKLKKTNATGYKRVYYNGTQDASAAFYIYDISVPVNNSKIITSVTIYNLDAASSNNRLCIFGICGLESSSVHGGVNKYGTITTDNTTQVGIYGRIGSSTVSKNGKKH